MYKEIIFKQIGIICLVLFLSSLQLGNVHSGQILSGYHADTPLINTYEGQLEPRS